MLLLVALGLLATLVLFSRSRLVGDLIAEEVAARVERATGAEVSIGGLRIDILGGDVEVESLAIEGGPDPLTSLRLEQGEIDISLSALLRGALRIESIELVRPRVRLRAGDEEEIDEPRDEAGGGIDLSFLEGLETLRILEGRVFYGDQSIPLSVDARGIDAEGLALAAGEPGRIGADSLRLELPGKRELTLDALTARFRLEAPELVLEEARFAGDELEGELGATLRFGTQGLLVEGSTALTSELGWLFPEQDIPAEGRVRGEAGFLVRSGGHYSVEGTLRALEGLEVAGSELESAEAGFSFSERGLYVVRGHAETRGGSRLEDLSLGFAEGRWTAAGDVELQLEEALRRAGLPEDLATGRLIAALELVSDDAGAFPSWSLHGTLEARERGAGRAPLRGSVEAAGDAEGSRASLIGRWGGSRVRARAELGALGGEGPPRWELDARVAASEGTQADAALERALEALAAKGVALPPTLEIGVSGGLEAEVVVAGRGAELSQLDAAVEMRQARLAGEVAGHLEGRARLGEQGVISVDARLGVGPRGEGLLAHVRIPPAMAPATLTLFVHNAPLSLVELATRALAGTELPMSLEGHAEGYASLELLPVLDELSGRMVVKGRVDMLPELAIRTGLRGGGARFGLERTFVDGPGVSLAGRGEVALSQPGGTTAPGPRVDASLDATLALAPLARTRGLFAAQGRVAASLAVEELGVGAPLEARGRVAWRGLRFGGGQLPEGHVDVVDAQGDEPGSALLFADDALEARLAVFGPLEEARGSLSVDADELEVIALAERLQGEPLPWPLSLVLSGGAQLEGPLYGPLADWRGEGRVGGLEITTPALGAYLVDPAPFELETGGRLRLSPAEPLVIVDDYGDRLEVGGGLGLLEPGIGLDLALEGTAELRLLEILDPELIARGQAELGLRLDGTLAEPKIYGSLDVDEGRLRRVTLREALDDVSAHIVFDGSVLRIESVSAILGGGTLEAEGRVRLEGFAPSSLDIAMKARDVSLSVPENLWGRYDADLRLEGPIGEMLLSGEARMLAGRYAAPFELSFSPWRRARTVQPGTTVASFLESITLDLVVRAGPVLSVRNRVARAELSIEARAGGSLARPLAAGSVGVLEGGEIEFRGVDYTLQWGQFSFDQLRGAPRRLRLRATTDVQGFRIRLELNASDEGIDVQLSSIPALSQNDIIALLLTGQTLSELGGDSFRTIGRDVTAAYFGYELGEMLFAGTAEKLGLSEFRVGTARVGPDARPTARVTLGRRLDDRTIVLYSRDVSADARDVYRIERELSRRFRAAVGREPLGGIAADVRYFQRLTGEGRDAMVREDEQVASEVVLRGVPEGVELEAGDDLELRARREVTQSGLVFAEELARRELAREGYVEARVRATLESLSERKVKVIVEVDAGPRWRIDYEAPDWAEKQAREELAVLWGGTTFRGSALDEAQRVLRDKIAEEGYSAALVEVYQPDADERRIVVAIDPGPRVVVEKLSLEGVQALDADDVREQVLSRPGGAFSRTIYRPRTLADDEQAIRTLYEKRGYLAASVSSSTTFSVEGDRVAITIAVEEGPRFRVDTVRVNGDWPMGVEPWTELVAFSPGEVFEPAALDTSEAALRSELDKAGYYDATLRSRVRLDEERVNLVFDVRPERRIVVDEVSYEGIERTKQRLVENAVTIESGESLTRAEVRESERGLFRLGVFRRVQIEPASAGEDAPDERRVVVRVEETPPIAFGGSLGYDTEEKIRGTLSVTHENLGGWARTASASVFASALRRSLRATLEDRNIRGGRFEGLVSVGPEIEEREGFTLQRLNATVQIGRPERLRRRWQLRYELEAQRLRDVTIGTEELARKLEIEGIPEDPQRIAGVTFGYVDDQRDDPFLPNEGWFTRAEAGLFETFLGSEPRFFRALGQAARYEPLGGKFTLAGSLRAGAAFTWGDTDNVPFGQRFFGGGADSVRGFERDRLGPFTEDGEFIEGGGEASIVTNLELRYRIFEQVDVALFYDIGNIFLRAEDVDLGNLRQSVGLGVRWRSPVGIIRLEYARKLDPFEIESSSEIFFSIGEPW